MSAASLGEIMITCFCSAGEMCRSFIDLAPASEKGECPLVLIIKRSHQDQKFHSNPTEDTQELASICLVECKFYTVKFLIERG